MHFRSVNTIVLRPAERSPTGCNRCPRLFPRTFPSPRYTCDVRTSLKSYASVPPRIRHIPNTSSTTILTAFRLASFSPSLVVFRLSYRRSESDAGNGVRFRFVACFPSTLRSTSVFRFSSRWSESEWKMVSDSDLPHSLVRLGSASFSPPLVFRVRFLIAVFRVYSRSSKGRKACNKSLMRFPLLICRFTHLYMCCMYVFPSRCLVCYAVLSL